MVCNFCSKICRHPKCFASGTQSRFECRTYYASQWKFQQYVSQKMTLHEGLSLKFTQLKCLVEKGMVASWREGHKWMPGLALWRSIMTVPNYPKTDDWLFCAWSLQACYECCSKYSHLKMGIYWKSWKIQLRCQTIYINSQVNQMGGPCRTED